ncbi:MAG: glycosyltransferase [gamma proteobacterium symbiont of Bathyaustriella thionipta]|nr:glycosyltransferase [gamma proteobacterium symbiont of Bathyaustriella thionipta]
MTIAYNAAETIEETILSVIDQDYAHIEYVVIDGASSDHTLDIIKKYKHCIDQITSEPDQGIADAMNKAIALATGDLILFLHADDYLLNNKVLSQAVSELKADTDIHAFSLFFSSAGQRQYRYPQGFGWRMNFKTGLYHQAVFCRRTLFAQIGDFSQQLRIAMDYEFFLRAHRRGIRIQLYSLPVSVMRDTGISSRQDWRSLSERFNEEREVQQLHCLNLWQKWMYRFYWALYRPYRRIRAML